MPRLSNSEVKSLQCGQKGFLRAANDREDGTRQLEKADSDEKPPPPRVYLSFSALIQEPSKTVATSTPVTLLYVSATAVSPAVVLSMMP